MVSGVHWTQLSHGRTDLDDPDGRLRYRGRTMAKFPRLVAHLWAWTVATGWKELPPELYEEEGIRTEVDAVLDGWDD